MRLHESDDEVVVETDTYRLSVERAHPRATLSDPDGADPATLLLLATLDSDRGLDGTMAHGPPRIAESSAGVAMTFEAASTTWAAKELRLECSDGAVEFSARVHGSARLATARLLGGPYTGTPRWGGGQFHSAWPARTLFDPSPDDPRRVVRTAHEPATIGVVGSSMPGRGHWFFTPAPLLIAGHPDADADPDRADGRWQTMELRCSVAEATFSELRYVPFLGGFSLELAYEGETAVDGEFGTPPLVLRRGVASPYEALTEHAAALRAAGLAPSVARERPTWWARPIFCGWGEQNRAAQHEGVHPTALSRRERYDGWLGHLEARGIVPGTVVIDDRWQQTYGGNEPDDERWPDLRGWIAARHDRGQRVLLWFKAWDPQGLPPEACVTDRLGTPVAADPTSPAYEAILRSSLQSMLATDGLDADGLKVDFTAQTPSGPGLRRAGGAWGIALLHRLLTLVYRCAKQAKPDALVVTHAVSPLFTDVTDMVRLNDLMRLDDPEPFAPAVPQMTHRARVAASIEPGMLVDTDDWCMPSRGEWRAYLAAKPALGVPALYYATGVDYSNEPFTDDDYAAIRDAWARYAAHRLQDADR